jgi:hypothetical protein
VIKVWNTAKVGVKHQSINQSINQSIKKVKINKITDEIHIKTIDSVTWIILRPLSALSMDAATSGRVI